MLPASIPPLAQRRMVSNTGARADRAEIESGVLLRETEMEHFLARLW